MTRLELLQSAIDGHIPAAVWARARELDRIDAATPGRRPAVRLRVKAWKPRGIVARLAGAMIRIRASAGACRAEDLIRAGFTEAEIARHGDAAVAEANRRYTRADAA